MTVQLRSFTWDQLDRVRNLLLKEFLARMEVAIEDLSDDQLEARIEQFTKELKSRREDWNG